jgi:endo-1,4-beta-xylanase
MSTNHKKLLFGGITFSMFVIFAMTISYLSNAFGSNDDKNLVSTMRSHDKYVGTTVQSQYLDYNAASADRSDVHSYRDALIHNFSSVTPEYEMKWDQLEPTKGNYNYLPVDNILGTAMKRGKMYRAHTLVWYQQVPQWAIDEKDNYSQLLNDLYSYIENVVQHYAGKVQAWDVVNEVVDDDPNNSNQFHLRDSLFAIASEHVYGNKLAYIENSFNLVHKYDPNSALYVNDYRVEGNNENDGGMQVKSDNYFELVKKLKADGIPITGVGFQSHAESDDGKLPSNLQATLERFASLGVSVAITELTDNNTATQGDTYKQAFRSCINVRACVGVTLWGFTDRHVNSANSGIFDYNYQRKPDYYAILGA